VGSLFSFVRFNILGGGGGPNSPMDGITIGGGGDDLPFFLNLFKKF